jgi:inner membrane protein import complex subunit Tim44-like protein
VTLRRALLVVSAGVLALFGAFAAYARVGGGDSYSGGGSSGGGGGGNSGGAELLYVVFRLLLWLTIEHPVIGIPVDIVVIVVVVRYFGRNNKVSVFTVSTAPAAASVAAASLDGLRRFDPHFSSITFSDFCYSLYGRAHEARGKGELDRYAPYLSDTARRALQSRNPQGLREVRGVVIGSFQVGGVRGLDLAVVSVDVTFESNYTEIAAAGESSWYVREQWTLERARDRVSPPPEKSKADHCPRCGAALRTRTDGACEYCGVKIEDGSFQWFVRGIVLQARESRGPLLTSNVPEQGTDRPTVMQPGFNERRTGFQNANPAFAWPAFLQRVQAIAVELQNAWTARDWERVRPLESESLFQMHRYWIDAYRKQHLRNVVADFAITRIEPVKIDADVFYESITVRLWAQGRDHTVDDSGRVVAGSQTQVRKWSEYWTFIRTRAAADGTRKIPCPNCGAQVIAGASGICDYCGGKLTVGEFDWVLSRIEQDEAYVG